MIKIAHVYYGLNKGGIERLIIDLSRHQAAKGQKIDIICLNKLSLDNLVNEKAENVRLICLNRKIGQKSPIFILKLFYILLKERYNIVHVHSAQIAKLIAFVCVRAKLIVHVHAINHICFGKFPKCRCVIGVSNTVSRTIRRQYKLDNVITVLNGVDNKDIVASGLEEKNRSLVSVGTLQDDVKQQSWLINELAPFLKEENVKLYFIGNGPDYHKLKTLVAELGLIEHVFFLGSQSYSWIKANLKNYDAFVHSSNSEGFNLSAIEAGVAGLALFLSDIDVHREITRNGKYGTLYNARCSGDLRQKINVLYQSDNFNEQTFVESIKYYRSNFSSQKFLKNIDEIYSEILIKE